MPTEAIQELISTSPAEFHYGDNHHDREAHHSRVFDAVTHVLATFKQAKKHRLSTRDFIILQERTFEAARHLHGLIESMKLNAHERQWWNKMARYQDTFEELASVTDMDTYKLQQRIKRPTAI